MEDLALSIRDDVALTTIAKLETMKMGLTLDWMKDIAKALGVAPSDLIEDRQGYRMLPMLGAIAAGGWSEAIQQTDSWIPVTGDDWHGREFVLRVDGDSMDEIAEPGDFVVIVPDDRALKSGHMLAVLNAVGETTFKRYQADPPQLLPCSRNPDHRPLLIGDEPFTVVGRVVKVMRDLR